MSDSSDPMDCSLPGSSVYGIFQARVLEWDAIAFSVSKASIIQVQAQPVSSWVQIRILLLMSCVILGKILGFSMPHQYKRNYYIVLIFTFLGQLRGGDGFIYKRDLAQNRHWSIVSNFQVLVSIV